MKSIISDAIILNKKDISSSSVLITLFTKEYGKIVALSYGIKNSKKRDKASIIPLSVSNVEIILKNGRSILENSTLIKIFKNIFKDLDKINISMYILHVLDNIIEENQKEEELYDKILEILDYLDKQKEMNSQKKYQILIAFLRRIMLELGIFDIDNFIENESYIEYLIKNKNAEIIDDELSIKILKFFEKYINEYFNIKINFSKFKI